MDYYFRRGIRHQPLPGRGSEFSIQHPQLRKLSHNHFSGSSPDSDIWRCSEMSYTSTSSDQRSETTEHERGPGQLSSHSHSGNEIYNEETIFYSSPDHLREMNTGQYGRSPSRLSFVPRNSMTGSIRSVGAFHNYCIFKFAEIEAATNKFDPSLVIGKGGFGKVYKGKMIFDAQEGLVAIKRWNSRQSNQTAKEFQSEIEKLSTVKHRNIVSLIGYCDENNEMILVYEYIPRGTLRSHLRRENKSPLPWKERLRICIGAANGLHYLHTGTEEQPIIHRDIKTTNILLDERLEAKIADFGLARQGPDRDQSHVSTIVQGTWGYIDPHYWRSKKLTTMSDVFSFGVVLLEVLTGLPPTDKLLSKTYEQPLSLARRHYDNKTLDKIIDPVLQQQIELKCLKLFSKTIMGCIAMDCTKRPPIGTVLHNLQCAEQMQEKAEKTEASSSVWALNHRLRF